MNDEKVLASYIPLVKFLSEVMGNNTEVVLHNLTNLDNSVIAIENGHVTGRKVGAPATDFVLKKVSSLTKTEHDFETNYTGRSSKYNKELTSSSYFIKNEEKIIGMLCINSDNSLVNDLCEKMSQFIETFNKPDTIVEHNGSESFSVSISDFANEAIEQVSREQGVTRYYLKSDDKIRVVHILYEKGFFSLKGAVPELSDLLKTSEPSIYRYLSSVKKALAAK